MGHLVIWYTSNIWYWYCWPIFTNTLHLYALWTSWRKWPHHCFSVSVKLPTILCCIITDIMWHVTSWLSHDWKNITRSTFSTHHPEANHNMMEILCLQSTQFYLPGPYQCVKEWLISADTNVSTDMSYILILHFKDLGLLLIHIMRKMEKVSQNFGHTKTWPSNLKNLEKRAIL